MTRLAGDPLHRRHRYPAEVIAHAVWLYFRFTLSLRMVEDDMLADRGTVVSPQRMKLWTKKFGRHVANDIRKRWAEGSVTNGTSMKFSSPSPARETSFDAPSTMMGSSFTDCLCCYRYGSVRS